VRERLGPGIYLGYALGSVGTGIYNTTNTLGIPASWAALAIFVPKLWDVITDPWMGSISDRVQTRWGRRPWLLLGGLTLPPCFALLFMTPDFGSPTAAFAWALTIGVLVSGALAVVLSLPFVSRYALAREQERSQA
jgi:Na+/melibiose symporter-like transporter